MKRHNVLIRFSSLLTLLGIVALMLSARGEQGWSAERWLNLSGGGLSQALSSERYYQSPNQAEVVTQIDGLDQNSLSRHRARFTAPVTGSYTFWITGDDSARLSYSPSGSKFDLTEIAQINSPIPFSFGFDFVNRSRSQAIALTAGQEILLEGLVKNAMGGGYLKVAASWQSSDITNWAGESGASATQSTTLHNAVASLVIDGERGGFTVSHTTNQPGSWVKVDLGQTRPLAYIEVYNRQSFQQRLSNFAVEILDSAGTTIWTETYHETSGYVKNILRVELPSGTLGHSVRVRCLGPGRSGEQLLNLSEIEVWGGGAIYEARALLDPALLVPYSGEAADSDNDELPDTWEAQHGFAPSGTQDGNYSPLADPDRDFLRNVDEARAGSDPFTTDSYAGKLTYEEWANSYHFTTGELTAAPTIYRTPEETKLLSAATTGDQGKQKIASRLRGYITAPETGEYRFWVSGRNNVDLFLSADQTKYRKRKIADLSRDKGALSGIPFHDPNLWDRYASQMSEKIHLTVGQKYYFETLQAQKHHGNAHVSLAWARPGTDREPLDMAYVSSYHVLAEDLDDDDLPDAWESANGLDPHDNGLSDIQREGHRGDYDADGLTNLQEYLLGTNPTAVDTDGDGYSDYTEQYIYHSDPTDAGSTNTELVQEVDLRTFYGSNASWSETSQGLIADRFRSGLSWDVTVPSSGYYFVEGLISLLGKVREQEGLAVRISINDQPLAIQTLHFHYRRPSSLGALTPYLTAGTHKVTIFFDSYSARRTSVIKELKLTKPIGIDANGDGIPDWLEDQVNDREKVTFAQSASFSSPAFIEGVSLSSEFPTLSAGGNSYNAQPVTDLREWFANVTLTPEGSTSIGVNFSQKSETLDISWETLDLESLQSQPLHIRLGDSLKMGGSTIASYTYLGTNYPVPPAVGYVVQPFSVPGVHSLAVETTSGESFPVTIKVAQAAWTETFSTPRDLVVNYPSVVNYAHHEVNSDLVFDGGDSIDVNVRFFYGNRTSPNGGFFRWTLLPRQSGLHGVAARLYKGGPIVGMSYYNAIQGAGATNMDLTSSFQSAEFPNYRIIRTPIVVSGLPEGGYAKVVIFKSGIMFRDGSQVTLLQAGDFVDGVAVLDFLFPIGKKGGYCHYIDLYDRHGNRINRL